MLTKQTFFFLICGSLFFITCQETTTLNYKRIENSIQSNTIEKQEQIIQQLFTQVLERQPSKEVVNSFITEIKTNKTTLAQIIIKTIISKEFHRKNIREQTIGDAIHNIYQKLLSKSPREEEVKIYRDLILEGKRWQEILTMIINNNDLTFLNIK